ncbi:hypothetical protein ACROYT_G032867 [Oculina patagonica]
MEHTKSGEKDGEEPDPKRHKGDPDTTKGKNVVVLLDSNVKKNGQVVFMPITIEMAQLKKPGKGQFKTNIKFTSEMTVMEGGNLESGRVARAEETQVSNVPAGTVLVPSERITTVSGPIQQRQPSLVQTRQEIKPLITAPVAYNIYSGTQTFTRASQQSLEQDMVSENRIVQWGSFPQPTVPPSGKQGNGSFFNVQAGAAGHSKRTAGQQPSTQVVQQELSPAAPTQNSSLNISSARPLIAYTCASVAGPSQEKQHSFVHGRQSENLSAPSVYNQYSDTQISSRTSQQSLEQDMVARKKTTPGGGFPQQSVPPSGKQGHGSYFVVQAGAAGHGKRTTGQQPSTQVVQQEVSSVAPTQKNSLDISSAAATQGLVNQVPATTLVQHQADLTDKTSKWGIPSKQNLPTSVPQEAATRPLMAYTCTSVTGPNQEKQPFFVQGRQENLSAPSVCNQYSDTQISSRTPQQTLEQVMVVGKRTAQWGSIPQQSVPPSGTEFLIAAKRLKDLSQTTSSSNQGHLMENAVPLHGFSSCESLQKQPVLLQTEQQGSSSQKGLPTAAIHKPFAVQAWSETEQLSVNQNERSLSGKHDHPENIAHQLVKVMSDREALDSAYESAVEDHTTVAHGVDKSKGLIEEIICSPSSGYTEVLKMLSVIKFIGSIQL